MADDTVAKIDELEGCYNGRFFKARAIRVGDEGLRAVAIGRTPGEPFKPLPYTELGALDPLLKRPGT